MRVLTADMGLSLVGVVRRHDGSGLASDPVSHPASPARQCYDGPRGEDVTPMDEATGEHGETDPDREQALAREFEQHRPRLRAVAHRVLGSGADADDAVQETWLRLSRSDTTEIA